MPRRVKHYQQPKLAPTAGDLGNEAYQANLADQDGLLQNNQREDAGAVATWESPEADNSPPGQKLSQHNPPNLGRDANYKHPGGENRQSPR